VNTASQVTIIVPAFNQLDYCRNCIQSILANTRRPHRLVLVDNGSTDGVAEYFDSVPGATVVHSKENLGFAGGVNLGLALAAGHVILLNSDTIVPPGWLGHLELALTSGPDWGAVGPVTNCASGDQQIHGTVLSGPEAVSDLAQERWQHFGPVVRETNRLVGFCLMLRDGVWQAVGEFDTRFAIGNYEDDDYCTRIRKAGYKLGVAEGTFIFHFGGRTFEGMGLQGEEFSRLMNENRRKYMEKWDVFVPEPGSGAVGKAADLRHEGAAAMAQGEISVAIGCYRRAIESDPGNADGFFGLADALTRAGHGQIALDTLEAGLKLNPSHVDALSRAKQLAKELGKAEALQGIHSNA
jgi:GT2 family glycosyltransferase